MSRNPGILFALIIFGIACENCFGRNATRLNATISDLTYFPCMVQIVKSNNQHVCGGCVLDEENVLTSAQCVKNFKQDQGKTDLKVRGGDVNITKSNLPTYQERKVCKFTVHPDYNEATLENNIALLKIQEPFMPSVNLHPVQPGMTGPKGRCFLPGWVNYDGNTYVLHYMTVYITSQDKCTKKVKNSICAESKTSEGTCEPDYGGPLVCGTKVYGIFIGPADACKGKPALFTNLSPFEDWMDLNIHENDELVRSRRISFSTGRRRYAGMKQAWTILVLTYMKLILLKI